MSMDLGTAEKNYCARTYPPYRYDLPAKHMTPRPKQRDSGTRAHRRKILALRPIPPPERTGLRCKGRLGLGLSASILWEKIGFRSSSPAKRNRVSAKGR